MLFLFTDWFRRKREKRDIFVSLRKRCECSWGVIRATSCARGELHVIPQLTSRLLWFSPFGNIYTPHWPKSEKKRKEDHEDPGIEIELLVTALVASLRLEIDTGRAAEIVWSQINCESPKASRACI